MGSISSKCARCYRCWTAAQYLSYAVAMDMQSPPTQQTETMLTIGQAAAVLGISTDTLRKWTDAGWVPSLRTQASEPNRRWRRYRLSDLYGVLAEAEQAAAQRQVSESRKIQLPTHRADSYHRLASQRALQRQVEQLRRQVEKLSREKQRLREQLAGTDGG